MLENRAEFMIAFAAVVAVCGVFVPLAPTAKIQDAGHQLRESDCIVVIASASHRQLLQEIRTACPSLRHVVVLNGEELTGLVNAAADEGLPLSNRETSPNDITAIYYTSGTTGMPKGCMLDHSWWLRVCDIHLRLTKSPPDTPQLCCLPFYHVDAVAQLLGALQNGSTLIIMRRFSVSRFWKVIHRFGVREIYIVASMPALLLKGEPDSTDRSHNILTAVCAAVPAHLHREFANRFGVVLLDSYGSTEAGWITRTPVHCAEAMVGSGSMGAAVPEVQLRVIGEFGNDVGPNGMGELLIRGPGMFRGYVNQPAATAQALFSGWYSSGDIVRVDERGLYYFVGRKKDFIRRSGENIACFEVEEVLRAHPLILDAALIAVPDDIHGQEAKACIRLLANGSADIIPPDQIVAYCTERLASFKVPRYIEYWTTDFPRTPTMRVKKDEMRGMHGTGKAWDNVRGGWIRES